MYVENYGYRNNYGMNNFGERQFIVPFLLGGLAGGAAVGLTRPRPIYNVAPQGYPYYPAPYYNSSYMYYQPYYY